MVFGPIIIQVVLLRKMDKLGKDEWFEARFGSMYEGLRLNSKAALLYPSTYFAYRLSLTAIVTLLSDDQAWQLMLLIFTSLLQTIYLIGVRPFEDPFQNFTELMNQFTINVTAYHLLIFTEFMPDNGI